MAGEQQDHNELFVIMVYMNCIASSIYLFVHGGLHYTSVARSILITWGYWAGFSWCVTRNLVGVSGGWIWRNSVSYAAMSFSCYEASPAIWPDYCYPVQKPLSLSVCLLPAVWLGDHSCVLLLFNSNADLFTREAFKELPGPRKCTTLAQPPEADWKIIREIGDKSITNLFKYPQHHPDLSTRISPRYIRYASW